MADDVSVRVRVYQRRQDKPLPVSVVFRVLQKTREMTATESVLDGDRFAAAGAADATYNLPLGLLDPGTVHSARRCLGRERRHPPRCTLHK